jgi:hypothetical protein
VKLLGFEPPRGRPISVRTAICVMPRRVAGVRETKPVEGMLGRSRYLREGGRGVGDFFSMG